MVSLKLVWPIILPMSLALALVEGNKHRTEDVEFSRGEEHEYKEIIGPEDDAITYQRKCDFFKKCSKFDHLPRFEKEFHGLFPLISKKMNFNLFNLFKHCYRHRRMPKYHNRGLFRCFGKFKKSGRIEGLFEEYDTITEYQKRKRSVIRKHDHGKKHGGVPHKHIKHVDHDWEIDTEDKYLRKVTFFKKCTTFDQLSRFEAEFKGLFGLIMKLKLRMTTKLFDFVRNCYKYPRMPKHHNAVYRKCIYKYKESGRCENLFEIYERETRIEKIEYTSHTEHHHGQPREEEGDTEKLYELKATFFKKCTTFEQLSQHEIEFKKLFILIKTVNVVMTSAFFNFVRNCYKYPRMPKHHNTVYRKCVYMYKESGRCENLFEIYERETRIEKIEYTSHNEFSMGDDTEMLYEQKSTFFKKCTTFEQLSRYETEFEKLFILIKTTKVVMTTDFFEFLRNCYKYPRMPKYHNQVYKKCIYIYKKSGRCDRLFELYERETRIEKVEYSSHTEHHHEKEH